MITYEAVKKALHAHASEKNREVFQRFFKTAKGEYGYGDQFIGIKVVQLRKVLRDFRETPLPVTKKLIQSKIHEERSFAIMILCYQYERAAKQDDLRTMHQLQKFVLTHKKKINNWDLVDGMAPYLTGHYWFHHVSRAERKKILNQLATSKSLWDRRIAVLSTYYFIRQKHFGPTLSLSKRLLNDKEDLMHKAVGWMLREIGNRDIAVLKKFLNEYATRMPRTMLRYAIEKFPNQERLRFLAMR